MARRARRAVPSAALTPEAGVARGLAVLAIVWQGLWILPDPALWPTRVGSTLSSVLLVAVIVAWLAVVATTWGPLAQARRRGIAQGVNLALLYTAAFDLFVDLPIDASDGWRQGASLVNLAVGLTGLLLPLMTAVPIVVTAVLVEGSLLLTLDGGRLPALTTTSEVLYPLYALAIGAATIGGRYGLMRAARRTESAQEELARAEARAEALRRVDLRLREQARALHEIVLNTLTAISRGGLPDSGDTGARIRERSAQSVRVLDSFAQRVEPQERAAGGRWAGGLEPVVSTLRAQGVAVELDVPDRAEPPVEIAGALRTALVEALTNVQRHAGAGLVRVRVNYDDDSVDASVVDDGIGFDPALHQGRFGLPESIIAPFAEVGGSATIDSAPGRGTAVRLAWRRPAATARWTPVDTTAFVRPVLIAFGALTLASAILTLADFAVPAAGVLALIIAFVAGGLLALGSRSGTLRPPLVIGVCLSAPLIMQLQRIGLGGAPPDPWSEWASEAIVGLMLVLAAAGPWWAWIAALGSWLLTQGDVVGELLQPGTAVIVAGALFARSVRANAAASAQALALRSVEQASALIDAESIRRIRERYSALEQSRAAALLSGIADGSIDPTDDEVRTACASEERFIRSVMRLDAERGALSAFALRMACAAHRQGMALDVDIPEADVPVAVGSGASRHSLERGIAELEASVTSLLPHIRPLEPARLTARVEGEELVVRVVVPAVAGGDVPASSGAVSVVIDTDAPMTMWELRHG